MKFNFQTIFIPSLNLEVNEFQFLSLRAQVKQGVLPPFDFTDTNGKVIGSVDSNGRVEGEYPFTDLNDMLTTLL
jgi:hypothetical protein